MGIWERGNVRDVTPQLSWRKSIDGICQVHAYKAKQSQDLTDLTSKDVISHLETQTMFYSHRQQRKKPKMPVPCAPGPIHQTVRQTETKGVRWLKHELWDAH